jgi:DNA-binding MarR family transcriptional regulator
MEENVLRPEFGPCYCANLRWVVREVSEFYKNLIGVSGLINTQYTLLSFLKIHGPLNMNGFVELTHLDRTTLTRNIKVLEKASYVSVFFDKSTSIKHFKIAPKGLAALKIADPEWDKAQAEFKAQFNDAEWEDFNLILQKLSKINAEAKSDLSPQPIDGKT